MPRTGWVTETGWRIVRDAWFNTIIFVGHVCEDNNPIVEAPLCAPFENRSFWLCPWCQARYYDEELPNLPRIIGGVPRDEHSN